MTKYEIFMGKLHDKGRVEAMQRAMNILPIPNEFSDEQKADIMKSCVGQAVHTMINTDCELKVAFDEAASELMFDRLSKDLDLKKDESFKPTALDELLKNIAIDKAVKSAAEKIAEKLFK